MGCESCVEIGTGPNVFPLVGQRLPQMVETCLPLIQGRLSLENANQQLG